MDEKNDIKINEMKMTGNAFGDVFLAIFALGIFYITLGHYLIHGGSMRLKTGNTVYIESFEPLTIFISAIVILPMLPFLYFGAVGLSNIIKCIFTGFLDFFVGSAKFIIAVVKIIIAIVTVLISAVF